MASTKRSMNWTSVVFTPTSGSPVTFTGVTAVSFDPGGSLADFSGDGDRFPTTIVNDMNNPGASISLADIAAAFALTPGQTGSLVATLNDAKNLAVTAGGAIIFTLAHAVVENMPIGGQHRQFGAGTITFKAYSADGTTNPLSSAAA